MNPLSKAFKELALERFTEKYRGEGLMLCEGVRELLRRRERDRFMKKEWPVPRSRIERLGIDPRTPTADFDD